MASNVMVQVTNIGAQKTGEQLLFGRCYQIKYYVVGNRGHDPATGLPVVPDKTLLALPGAITNSNPGTALGPNSAYLDGPRSIVYEIVLPQGVVSGNFSSIGLVGEIVSVVEPTDNALLGTTFLHSVANFPLQNKLSSESKTIRLRMDNV